MITAMWAVIALLLIRIWAPYVARAIARARHTRF